VIPDRYANGDPSNDTGGYGPQFSQNGFDPTSTAYWHGGDFKGLTGGCTDPVHGLERIKDLGFNAVWVTPPVVNQVRIGGSGGYHGYWGLDFTRVDPHLGADADFGAFVACAHSLGMKVIMDVVVNHTGDVIILSGGGTYSDAPFRDCHGRVFHADRYVTARRFPCLAARFMPEVPYVAPEDRHLKKPEWLNDPLNYHDRGNIDFGSCSQQCFEQGDFFGLDDLFTEKPNVERGLAAIFSDWVRRYKLDGFRIDTARHVNAAFFRLWVPQILAVARAASVPDFQIFGELFTTDVQEIVPFIRDRGLPNALDFPFQDAAAGYAAGSSSAVAISNRLEDDDYFRLPNGHDPAPPTFLGNHDMGRAAFQISQHGGGLPDDPALLRRTLLGYDLMYFLRGAPTVYYGDEVGMIGTGGDQQAREDMFPTKVGEWQREPRLGGPRIGTGSSFDVRANPIEARLRELAALRDAYPELATGATTVRYAKGKVLVVSRFNADKRRELVVAFNAGDAAARVAVPVATAADYQAVFGATGAIAAGSRRITLDVPRQWAIVYASTTPIAAARPVTPALKVGPDDLTNYRRATATVTGDEPVTVAFAVHTPGGTWQRLAIDDSPPYRAFLDPRRYRRGTQISLVAIARSLDGSTATSRVVTVRFRR
jgi:alpha-amylase